MVPLAKRLFFQAMLTVKLPHALSPFTEPFFRRPGGRAASKFPYPGFATAFPQFQQHRRNYHLFERGGG